MSYWIRTASLSLLRKSRRNAQAFIMFTALACALAIPVAAQNIDASKIKKIPHFNGLSDAQFTTQTDLYKDQPESDHFLSYTVRLPKGWRRATGEKLTASVSGGSKSLTHLVLGKVGSYFSNGVDQFPSHFDIQAMSLDYNISTRNWFLNYIVSNGYTLEGMQQIDDTRVEALYVLVENDTSYVVRAIAQINGSRMVLASYSLPDERWQQERAFQEKCLNSFAFTNPEPVRIEKTLSYTFLDLLKFDYPSSWRLDADDASSTDEMDARLINSKDNENLNGEINLRVISTDTEATLASEVQKIRQDLHLRGIEVGGLIEAPDDFKFPEHVYFHRVEVYDAHSKAGDFAKQEFWLAIMVEDRYYYIVDLLTPSRNANFVVWARNVEALQTVVANIKPLVDPQSQSQPK